MQLGGQGGGDDLRGFGGEERIRPKYSARKKFKTVKNNF